MGDNILRRGAPVTGPRRTARAPTAEISRQELRDLLGQIHGTAAPADADLEPELELIPDATPLSLPVVAPGKLAHTLKRAATPSPVPAEPIAIGKPTTVLPPSLAQALFEHASAPPVTFPALPPRRAVAEREALVASERRARIRHVAMIALIAAAFGEVAFLVFRALAA